MEKILCVDDDENLLTLYQEELSEEGYEVILSRNGKEALSMLDREKPKLVIMDAHLPVMGGVELIAAMLRKNDQIQVILNTADPQYGDNFKSWGATDFVLKSSDLSELKEKIREALRGLRRKKK